LKGWVARWLSRDSGARKGKVDVLHATPRPTNKQIGDGGGVPMTAAAIVLIFNRLKTRKISAQAIATANCTQWHRLCLIEIEPCFRTSRVL
jgi:hypothetical protein